MTLHRERRIDPSTDTSEPLPRSMGAPNAAPCSCGQATRNRCGQCCRPMCGSCTHNHGNGRCGKRQG